MPGKKKWTKSERAALSAKMQAVWAKRKRKVQHVSKSVKSEDPSPSRVGGAVRKVSDLEAELNKLTEVIHVAFACLEADVRSTVRDELRRMFSQG